jgi:hypothetical protein
MIARNGMHVGTSFQTSEGVDTYVEYYDGHAKHILPGNVDFIF